ncbi:hypothetical protein BGZ65_006795 [Modicella reniformis]|uniref:F-box domain-containing protein n=1 Tax=Modicella reniformis TaxID=1440133 RepID=A0A9P6M8B9_9FUNG|nr:hypothetical protein BGZ65_006795 [Modicella reniformis]
MPFSRDHPLLIPEIAGQLSRFVSLNDALACIRVCKEWNVAFISVIWHTVDFETQKRFNQLSSTVIQKYGHHIHTVRNINTTSQLEALHHPGICKMRNLTLSIQGNSRFEAYSLDILRQNVASLLYLDLSSEDISTEDHSQRGSTCIFPVDAFYPCVGTSTRLKLSHLILQNFALTRDMFSSLLRLCPALETLNIQETSIYSANCITPFQHTGLIRLDATLSQVFLPDPEAPNAPSLLAHFPQLRALRMARAVCPVPIEKIKNEIARYGPRLRSVGTSTPATFTAILLAQTFQSLSEIIVRDDGLSAEVINAILAHQETLNNVSTYVPFRGYCNQSEVPELEKDTQLQGWAIQLLPRLCSQLTTINFPTLEMDMDDVEKASWSCTKLKVLYIRIKGLDTKTKIDRTLDMLVSARSMKKELAGDFSSRKNTRSTSTSLIEDRVVQHLLRFRRLQKVWLGHKLKVL